MAPPSKHAYCKGLFVKAESPILVTEEGIKILGSKLVSNAPAPILVTDDGIVTRVMRLF